MAGITSLKNLPEVIDLGPVNQLLDRLFGGVFDHIEITDFFETTEDGVRSYTLTLGVEESFVFPVPGLDGITLGVVRESEDERPVIYCEMAVAGAPVGIAVRHFPLRVGIENPYLLPVDGSEGMLPGFVFEVEGAFGVNANLDIEARVENFSLPPFTIAGTGITLGLDGCRIVTHDDGVDDAIRELGFDEGFRGIFAESALLDWDVPFQALGADVPGLHATLEKIAIGNQGVSVASQLQWTVTLDGQQFDEDQTELLGSLFDTGWQAALEQLDVVIEANRPVAMRAAGYLRIPFIDTIVQLSMGYAYDGEDQYSFNATLRQNEDAEIAIPLGSDSRTLVLSNFLFEGGFDTDGRFALDGSAAMDLSLPGLTIDAASVGIRFDHQHGQDTFKIDLQEIDLDGVGHIDEAQLLVAVTEQADGSFQLAALELSTHMRWEDIQDRIALGQVPDAFPLPPDDADITLQVRWAGDVMQLSLAAELTEVDRLWRFVPAPFRPQVETAAIAVALNRNGSDFDGELSLDFLLRLPDIPALLPAQAMAWDRMIHIDTGDADNTMHVIFKAAVGGDGDVDQGRLSAAIEHPVAIALQLPGMALPEPPVRIAVETMGISLGSDPDTTQGLLTLGGQFELRPVLPEHLNGVVPPVMAQQLDQLLAVARRTDLTGSAGLELGINDDTAWFKAHCDFQQAGISLDLFDMLADTLRGGATLANANASANEIDLDIDVSVDLKQISIAIGDPAGGSDAGIPFSFGIAAQLGFAAQTADVVFELSDDSLSFGIEQLSLPIAIPKLPLSRTDLDALRGAGGQWDYDTIWLTQIEPQLAADIQQKQAALNAARQQREALEQDQSDPQALFELQYRTMPAIEKALFQLVGRKFLYEAILAVHQVLGAGGSRAAYQNYVEIYQEGVDKTLGAIHFDSQLRFDITDAKFVLPFNDPSDIRVEGGAAISGFVDDDPLKPLSELVFKLGISADAVYFSVEGGAEPIALPDFGRYPGSAVNLDRLVIGYGYTKNSLVVDFAGELILSEALIEEADTSEEVGFGVRLPRNNKLQFKLDLIPIVLGEVDFLLPLIAFDIDLRSDAPPPAPVATGGCRPAWDGLQLIVPGVVRADLKRYKVSPFFGPVPALNALMAMDIDIGNEQYGISHISDDYTYIGPLFYTLPVPFLADTVPFFNRYCVNLRLGGFGLNVDLSRPFPHPSPLLIFELFGFLSDPTAPIDPNGHIANLMYVELANARITLPPPVQAMFPALSGVVDRDFSGKINVATVMALARQAQDLGEQLVQRLENQAHEGLEWIEAMIASPPHFSLTGILGMLPTELRSVTLQGRFVLFDADATFVLALADDIKAQLGGPAPLPPPAHTLIYENDFKSGDLSGWHKVDYGLKNGAGDWRVINHTLVQTGNVGDNSPARYGTMLVYGAEKLGNLRIEVTASAMDNDGLGVVFLFEGKDTFYRFRMTAEQNRWHLDKLRKGEVTTLYEKSQRYTPKQTYAIRVETAVAKRATRIQIWVDDRLWCDIQDKTRPLTQGHVGLDSWWNKGAAFDRLALFRRTAPVMTQGQPVADEQLPVLAAQLDNGSADLSGLFAGFSQADIAEAMAGADALAMAVTARVKVVDSAVYDMVGVFHSDGRFRLTSSLEVASIPLAIAGFDLSLAAQVQGRITLSGRSAGADSWAAVEASVFGDWVLLPGTDPAPKAALARLRLADAAHPAVLKLSGSAGFSLRGDGLLELFAQQLRIIGAVDISPDHLMIAGELTFAPDIFVQSQRMLTLSMAVNGRVGPGPSMGLSGEGALQLFGKPFTHTRAMLTDRMLEIATELTGSGQSWQLGPLQLKDVAMQLQGRVDFRDETPAVAFDGRGGFNLLGAGIEGAVALAADQNGWRLSADGRLSWQGHEWAGAALTLSDQGVVLQGSADFGLPLTPGQLPAGIQVLGLFLNARVSGRFELNPQGRLVAWDFRLNWQLAARLPGQSNGQSLPIATQQFTVKDTNSAGDDLFSLIDLITINGLTLFNLDSVTVPVPTVDLENGQGIYVRNSVDIDVDGDAGVSVVTPFPPSDNATPVLDLGLVKFYNDEVDLPALSLPIPVLTNTPRNSADQPLFRVPGLSTEDVPLGDLAIGLPNVQLQLKLAWQNGKLGILVAGENRFIPFDVLLPVFTVGTVLVTADT